MAKKRVGRPPTSERNDIVVKLDRSVAAQARYIAETRGVSMAEYLTAALCADRCQGLSARHKRRKAMIDLEQFAALVTTMREKQRKYAKTRFTTDLLRAKRAEDAVDPALQRAEAPALAAPVTEKVEARP